MAAGQWEDGTGEVRVSGVRVVVMGVSGSGKSTVGALVAEALGAGFVDGDDLHPAANVEKMRQGIPLTDEDREPWLRAVGRTLADAGPAGMVVACSALKRTYRDLIRAEAPGTFFAELDGGRDLLAERMIRPGHFMPASLLDSQLATLESLQPDEEGVRLDVSEAPADLVTAIVDDVRSAVG
jgi:gluconokinase